MSRTATELQKRVDILVKSLEKEIQDAKRGIVPGSSGKRRIGDKKRESFMHSKSNAMSDDDQALVDRAEVRPNADDLDDADRVYQVDEDEEMLEPVRGDDRSLAKEMQVRLGGEIIEDPIKSHARKNDLAGQKRAKREYSDEEEDMDFEAIQNQGEVANNF